MKHANQLFHPSALLLLMATPFAHAALTTTGTGQLATAGDSINGTMVIDSVTVAYTLTLTSASLDGPIEWNGVGRASASGLSWNDNSPEWTLELSLSRPVNLVVVQSGGAGFANEPTSVWTIGWDSLGATTILDPANQLDDPATIAGAGTTTHSSLSRVINGDAQWSISGPDSSTYTIAFENPTGIAVGTDAIGFDEVHSSLGCPPVDTDTDGITDNLDNCILVANSDQRDSDADGYGNACDADLNNDLAVNAIDLGLFRTVFFTDDADADFNSDGTVNVVDLGILRGAFFMPPGPSCVTP